MGKLISKVTRIKDSSDSVLVSGIYKISGGEFGEFNDLMEGLSERQIMDLIDEARNNRKEVAKWKKDLIKSKTEETQKKLVSSKLQKKHIATGVTITALALLIGFSLGKNMVKAPGLDQGLDLGDNTVEVQKSFTMQMMVDEVNAMNEVLAKNGIERSDNKLFSFYFVNNIQYFDEELTELLIEEKLLPDTAEKILNDYNGVFNDIMNHNLKAIYQNKGQVIELNNFVKDDFDKAFIGAIDKETADIFKAPTNEAGYEEYQEAKAMILGIKATSANDTIHEMSAGAQYLSTYAQGVMTVVHGATKGVPQADIDNFEGVIEAARADIHAYMVDVCPSLESVSKTK